MQAFHQRMARMARKCLDKAGMDMLQELNVAITGYGHRVEGCSGHPLGKPPGSVAEPMHPSFGSGIMHR